jgi:hypothetical protein
MAKNVKFVVCKFMGGSMCFWTGHFWSRQLHRAEFLDTPLILNDDQAKLVPFYEDQNPEGVFDEQRGKYVAPR